jgi:hypothetical protein
MLLEGDIKSGVFRTLPIVKHAPQKDPVLAGAIVTIASLDHNGPASE